MLNRRRSEVLSESEQSIRLGKMKETARHINERSVKPTVVARANLLIVHENSQNDAV